jgi:hypothetical protein
MTSVSPEEYGSLESSSTGNPFNEHAEDFRPAISSRVLVEGRRAAITTFARK